MRRAGMLFQTLDLQRRFLVSPGQRVIVGRRPPPEPQNVRIPRDNISRQHVCIRGDGGGTLVEDAGSTGGARVNDDDEGHLNCNPLYVALEVAPRLRLSPPADLYSLALITFEAMTRRRPFGDETPRQVQLAKLLGPPRPGTPPAPNHSATSSTTSSPSTPPTAPITSSPSPSWRASPKPSITLKIAADSEGAVETRARTRPIGSCFLTGSVRTGTQERMTPDESMRAPEAADWHLIEEHGFLVLEGEVATDALPDHRDLREQRIAELVRRSFGEGGG